MTRISNPQPQSPLSLTNGKTARLRTWVLALGATTLAACSMEAGDEPEASRSDLMRVGDVLYPLPKPLPGPLPIDPEQLVQITAGSNHTCVRKRNGNVYCWGRDDRGQVGRQHTATCVDSPDACVDRPRLVAAANGFTTAWDIDAGHQHTCALDSAGKAFCWGDGDRGELGRCLRDPNRPKECLTGYSFEPAPVDGRLSFSSLAAGTQSTCGVTADGIYCWGLTIPNNVPGASRSLFPTRIYASTGLSPSGISVGAQHVCAQWVSGAFRETNCWGQNSVGQTGANQSPVSLLGQGPDVGTVALRVTTQSTFTCVDQPGPSVVCFGEGSSGQLGSGGIARTSTPQVVGGATPAALSGVTTGQFHACALDTNGYAYCWGGGNFGQLGNGLVNGFAQGSTLPVPVTGGIRFRALAAGQLHTCGIAIDNGIYCWGSNHHGELGTQYKSPNQNFTNGWVASPVRALDPY